MGTANGNTGQECSKALWEDRKCPQFQESEECHFKDPKTKEDFHKPGGEQGWKAGPGRGGHSSLRELGEENRGRKNTGTVLEILRSQLVSALAEDAGVGSENGVMV